jgi:hypothetical protein
MLSNSGGSDELSISDPSDLAFSVEIQFLLQFLAANNFLLQVSTPHCGTLVWAVSVTTTLREK